MAGYDISASFSESGTQGLNNKLGDFTIGGGGKASIVWPIVLGVVGLVVLWWWYR